jgi:predicted kinase
MLVGNEPELRSGPLMIVVMAGLPGTGKSVLARELAARVSGSILSKDEIRHTLFDARDVEYSTEQDDFCMEVMLQTAAYILARRPDRIIFIDGRTFSRREQLRCVVDYADRLNQPWRILECVCSEPTAKARLDLQQDHPAENRDFELYRRVRERFEEIDFPKTLLDTDQPLDVCVQRALSALR